MVNYFSNAVFLQNQTYYAIIDCQTFLKNHGIPYVFGFFYNPFDHGYTNQFGNLDRKNILYQQVNWDKFIKIFPIETGIEFDLLDDDGVHLSIQGQIKWARQIEKTVNKEIKNNDLHFPDIFKYFKRNC
jgi:lysophospholipase L1-like esterase